MVKTILIVEDDEMSMRLFNDLLQSHGFNTLQSVDGLDTVQLAREHHPDLIIMDIQLPHVSGLEHTKALKADDDLKDIPVLAVTGFAIEGDEQTCLNAGCDGYISKPISVPHFLEEVRRFATTAPFRLTDALKIGNPQIDAEHEHIVVLINQFLDFLQAGDDKGCAGKIDEITKAFKSHLINEEKIMEELGYYHLDEHKTEHITAVRKYNTLITNAQDNGYGGSFANELVSLFADFIIRVDMGFKMYLEKADS